MDIRILSPFVAHRVRRRRLHHEPEPPAEPAVRGMAPACQSKRAFDSLASSPRRSECAVFSFPVLGSDGRRSRRQAKPSQGHLCLCSRGTSCGVRVLGDRARTSIHMLPRIPVLRCPRICAGSPVTVRSSSDRTVLFRIGLEVVVYWTACHATMPCHAHMAFISVLGGCLRSWTECTVVCAPLVIPPYTHARTCICPGHRREDDAGPDQSQGAPSCVLTSTLWARNTGRRRSKNLGHGEHLRLPYGNLALEPCQCQSPQVPRARRPSGLRTTLRLRVPPRYVYRDRLGRPRAILQ
ncbi:hypothetical protein C8Q80DRAFT_209810 [Daedaleopsis nitida]|nr:hypothetical protein C8Q80DRAFT_209810 [Daedaleopsis nitida]